MRILKKFFFFAFVFLSLGLCANAQLTFEDVYNEYGPRLDNALSKLLYEQGFNPEKGKKAAERIYSRNIENFYKVSPILYRGAQPDEAGIKELAEMGIKTIIDLQFLPSNEKDIAAKYGIKYYHISVSPFLMVDNDVQLFLDILSENKNTPVFVHCYYGSDRTGAMVAIYRIAFEKWSNRAAEDEMTKGDYGYRNVCKPLSVYVKNFALYRFKIKGTLRDLYPAEYRQGKIK